MSSSWRRLRPHSHSLTGRDKGGREIYSTLSLASCSPAVSQAFLKAAGSKSVSPNKGFPRKAFDLSHLTQTIDGKDGRVTHSLDVSGELGGRSREGRGPFSEMAVAVGSAVKEERD